MNKNYKMLMSLKTVLLLLDKTLLLLINKVLECYRIFNKKEFREEFLEY